MSEREVFDFPEGGRDKLNEKPLTIEEINEGINKREIKQKKLERERESIELEEEQIKLEIEALKAEKARLKDESQETV